MANVSERDKVKARQIVRRCGLRDGLFKGPRTLNAVETIAYEFSAQRGEFQNKVIQVMTDLRVNSDGQTCEVLDLVEGKVREILNQG